MNPLRDGLTCDKYLYLIMKDKNKIIFYLIKLCFYFYSISVWECRGAPFSDHLLIQKPTNTIFFQVLLPSMCLCNTNAPDMANSKYGQGHKDKYLDSSRKILSREMLMCNMKALMFLIYKL